MPTLISSPFLTEQVRGERFLSTCTLESLELGFFTHLSANIDDMAELKKRIILDPEMLNSIGCITEGEKELLSSLFTDFPIDIVDNYKSVITPEGGVIAGFANIKVFYFIFISLDSSYWFKLYEQ